MTDEQINIAIAEACGWYRAPKTWVRPDGQSWSIGIPNYCHDLNAMHEAEMVLTECADDNYANFQNYLYHLEMIVCNALGKDCTDDDGWSGFIAFATARQRSEAFLRVKGLWKEEA